MSNTYVLRQEIQRNTFWKNAQQFLIRLDMELTERCNNNCVHCYINLPATDFQAKRRELSLWRIKQILKEAVSLGCMVVRFTGGEPLLRKDFRQIYIFARKQGLRVLLFTNATLITKEMAELFKRLPLLEKIEVSVFGLKKSSYEGSTRTAGSFAKAMAGIKLLLEMNIPFAVKGALLPANRNELNEFKSWAAALPGMDAPTKVSMFFDLRCRRDEKNNELIKKIRIQPLEGLKILAAKKEVYIKTMRHLYADFNRLTGDRLFSCGVGCLGGCVDAYGFFQPCMMLRHPDTIIGR